LAALLLLAACPLPQSVPSVPAGSVTPPRIVEDATLTPAGTTVPFDPTCPAAPQPFTVTATVADENFSEAVDYRWFVDYDPAVQPGYMPLARGTLDPPTAEPFTLRPVKPDFVVRPADFTPASGTHVLELVVSNGFDQRPDLEQGLLPLPYRTPLSDAQNRYEVQSHKWVFVPVPGCGTAPPPTCAPCPP
jgi:hypothetical protein